MRSREISLKLNMWHFQISIWLECPFGEVHFAENPTWNGPVVPKLWVIIEGFSEQLITTEIHSFFWLYQCSRLPTDSARSQHISHSYNKLQKNVGFVHGQNIVSCSYMIFYTTHLYDCTYYCDIFKSKSWCIVDNHQVSNEPFLISHLLLCQWYYIRIFNV